MAIPNWREHTIKLAAEVVGPVAEIIVDDTIEKYGFADTEMVPTTYLRFLESLYKELPMDVDRKTLCLHIRDTVIKNFGH
ncbi:MAG: hypothetical protein V3S12_04840 [Acidiferrobacterales bacterium]